MIAIYKKEILQHIPLTELERITGVPYLSALEFTDGQTLCRIGKKTKGIKLDPEHSWLSAYFRKEVLSHRHGSIQLRWLDEKIGWGVFAEEDIPSLSFVAEYTGLVRKRTKRDAKNAYCFEYPLAPGRDSPYVIDAQNMGGLARYVNHAEDGNVTSLAVHIEGFNHIILYTNQKILKGTQLCYDYGPGYWKARPKPRPLQSTDSSSSM